MLLVNNLVTRLSQPCMTLFLYGNGYKYWWSVNFLSFGICVLEIKLLTKPFKTTHVLQSLWVCLFFCQTVEVAGHSVPHQHSVIGSPSWERMLTHRSTLPLKYWSTVMVEELVMVSYYDKDFPCKAIPITCGSTLLSSSYIIKMLNA